MESQTYRLRWDGKRYYLPAALRNQISCKWVLTKSAEGLALVSMPRWRAFLVQVQTMDDSALRENCIRFKINPACEVDLRKKNLYIPKSLTQWAGLGRGDATFLLNEDYGNIFPVERS